MPLSDGGAETGEEPEAEGEGGVATEIAVATEAIEDVEDALAAGELTADEAATAEQVIEDAVEVALADEPAGDGGSEEGRGDA